MTRKGNCCVCDCLTHPYHSNCSVDTCNCTLYEDEDNE